MLANSCRVIVVLESVVIVTLLCVCLLDHIIMSKCTTYSDFTAFMCTGIIWSFSPHMHPFNGPLSGTTRVSWYQKGKTRLNFTQARNRDWQWHQLGCMQVCTSLQTANHASTPPLGFYRPSALPVAQPTASVHWRRTITLMAHHSACDKTIVIPFFMPAKCQLLQSMSYSCDDCRRGAHLPV